MRIRDKIIHNSSNLYRLVQNSKYVNYPEKKNEQTKNVIFKLKLLLWLCFRSLLQSKLVILNQTKQTIYIIQFNLNLAEGFVLFCFVASMDTFPRWVQSKLVVLTLMIQTVQLRRFPQFEFVFYFIFFAFCISQKIELILIITSFFGELNGLQLLRSTFHP